MKNLLSAGRVLAMDLASTVLFLTVYLLTDSLFLAVGLGMALGVTQILLRGIWPSSTVQADWHGPTIFTSTLRAASPAQRLS